MGDANFGCGRNERHGRGCDCDNSCLWIILLLLFCGGNTFGMNGCGCGNNSCIWIIILLLFCGGNTFGVNGCGCEPRCGCDDGCC